MANVNAGTNWAAHSEDERASFIRYFFVNYLALNAANDANPFPAAATAGPSVGATYAVGQYPTRGQMRTFRARIFTTLRDYLDPVGLGFATSVDDSAILDLSGDDHRLAAPTEALQSDFIRAVGLRPGSTDARETGVEKESAQRKLKETAILTPDQYIRARDADLNDIDTKSLVVYRTSFDKYYNVYKYPREEAQKKAIEDKDVYKEILIKQHNLIYDNTIYNEAKKKIVKMAA